MHPTFRDYERENEKHTGDGNWREFENGKREGVMRMNERDIKPQNSKISEFYVDVCARRTFSDIESTLCNIWLMSSINKSKSMLGYFCLATM